MVQYFVVVVVVIIIDAFIFFVCFLFDRIN